MSISFQNQYQEIKTALETGQTLAFDKTENCFTILSSEVTTSEIGRRYITDLAALKDKAIELTKQNHLTPEQSEELSKAFDTAAQRSGQKPATLSGRVHPFKDDSTFTPKATQQTARQATKIPSHLRS